MIILQNRIYIKSKIILMTEEFVPFHQHLLMKIWVSNPPKDVEILNKWFIDLVHKVGMQVVGGPTSVYVDHPGNEGLTGTVTLATSHASIHIWDHLQLPMIQFDIYSCKCFNLADVVEQFEPWNIVKYEWVMIDRNNKPTMIENGEWSKMIEYVNENS